MPRWRLVMQLAAVAAMLSAPASGQAPVTPAVPSPGTPAIPYTAPLSAPPSSAIPYAAPQLSPPPQSFDPYTLPSSVPPQLPPGLPPSLPPTAIPPTTPYPLPGQTAPVTPLFGPQNPATATPRRGFYGGFEGAVLEPRLGVLRISQAVTPVLIPPDQVDAFRLISNSTDFDLTFSPRIWGGYMGSKGFGGRVQWWYFDADSKTNTIQVDDLEASLQSHLEYSVFDFEATQLGALQTWQFELGGGVRYAKIDQSLDSVLIEPPDRAEVSVVESFEGFGPTVSFTAKRPIGNWEGLTFVGKTRYSILFGDVDLDTTIVSPVIDVPELNLIQLSDATWTSWEISVGALWSRILTGGAVFNLGAYLEGQVWSPDNHGFFGPTFHVSISR